MFDPNPQSIQFHLNDVERSFRRSQHAEKPFGKRPYMITRILPMVCLVAIAAGYFQLA